MEKTIKKDLMILLTCKAIRRELNILRQLIGDEAWIDDENLRATDTVIWMYEQAAYQDFKKSKTQAGYKAMEIGESKERE